MVLLPVDAPDGTLRVQNGGEIALRLQVEDTSVWIQPGTTLSLPVPSGNLAVAASIKEPRGEFKTFERALWIEPGRVTSEVVRPDPTVLTLVNRDQVAVHVKLDGEDAGLLAPGASRVVYVRPGTTRVTFVDLFGRARMTQVVDVPRGEEARVVLADPVPVPVRTVVVTHPAPLARPVPPHRHGHR
jgi:hypothetical protein